MGYDIPKAGVTSRYLLFHLVSLLNRRLLLCNQCVYVQSLAVIKSGSLFAVEMALLDVCYEQKITEPLFDFLNVVLTLISLHHRLYGLRHPLPETCGRKHMVFP